MFLYMFLDQGKVILFSVYHMYAEIIGKMFLNNEKSVNIQLEQNVTIWKISHAVF